MARKITKQKLNDKVFFTKDGELNYFDGDNLKIVKDNELIKLKQVYFKTRYVKKVFDKKSLFINNKIEENKKSKFKKIKHSTNTVGYEIVNTNKLEKDLELTKYTLTPDFNNNDGIEFYVKLQNKQTTKSIYRTLYNGEKIQIDETINIINKISKLFTDYLFCSDDSKDKFYKTNNNNIIINPGEFSLANENEYDNIYSKINSLSNIISNTYNTTFYKQKFYNQHHIKSLDQYIESELQTKFSLSLNKTLSVLKPLINYIISVHLKLDRLTEEKVKSYYNAVSYELLTGTKFDEHKNKKFIDNSFNFKRNTQKIEIENELIKCSSDELESKISEIINDYKLDSLINKIKKKKYYNFIQLKNEIAKHYTNTFNDELINTYNDEQKYILKYVHDMVKSRYRKTKKYQDSSEKIKSINIIESNYFKRLKCKIIRRFIERMNYKRNINNKSNLYFDTENLSSLQKELIKAEDTYRQKMTPMISDIQHTLSRKNQKNDSLDTWNNLQNNVKKSKFIIEDTELKGIFKKDDYINYFGLFRLRNHIYHFQRLVFQNQDSKENFKKQEEYISSRADFIEEYKLYELKKSKEYLKINLTSNNVHCFTDQEIKDVLELIQVDHVRPSYLPRFDKLFSGFIRSNLKENYGIFFKTDESLLAIKFYLNIYYENDFIPSLLADPSEFIDFSKKNQSNEYQSINKYLENNDLSEVQLSYTSDLKSDPIKVKTMNNKFNDLLSKFFYKKYAKVFKSLKNNYNNFLFKDPNKAENDISEQQDKNKNINDKRINAESILKDEIEENFNLSTKYNITNELLHDIFILAACSKNNYLSELIQNTKKYKQFLSSLSLKYSYESVNSEWMTINSKLVAGNEIDLESYLNQISELILHMQSLQKFTYINNDLKPVANLIRSNQKIDNPKIVSNLVKEYSNQTSNNLKVEHTKLNQNEYFYPFKEVSNTPSKGFTKLYFHENSVASHIGKDIELKILLEIHKDFMVKHNLCLDQFKEAYLFFIKDDFTFPTNNKLFDNVINDSIDTIFSDGNTETSIKDKLFFEKNNIYSDNKNKQLDKNIAKKLQLITKLLNTYDFVVQFKNFRILEQGEQIIHSITSRTISSYYRAEREISAQLIATGSFEDNKKSVFNGKNISNLLFNNEDKSDSDYIKKIIKQRNSAVHKHYIHNVESKATIGEPKAIIEESLLEQYSTTKHGINSYETKYYKAIDDILSSIFTKYKFTVQGQIIAPIINDHYHFEIIHPLYAEYIYHFISYKIPCEKYNNNKQ